MPDLRGNGSSLVASAGRGGRKRHKDRWRRRDCAAVCRGRYVDELHLAVATVVQGQGEALFAALISAPSAIAQSGMCPPSVPPTLYWPAKGSFSWQLLQSINAHYAEPVPERVAAEGDGRIAGHAVHLLSFCASCQSSPHRCFKILDTKIDVNGRPVSLVPANVTASFRR